MAGDSTINGLTPSGTLNGAEVFPGVQSGTTKKVSLTSIYNYIRAGLVTLTGAQTLEDKRITSRVYSAVFDSNLDVDSDLYDVAINTAIAGTITIGNPTGTPTEAQALVYRLTSNSSAHTINWSTDFEDYGATMPVSTVASKTIYVGFLFNTDSTTWNCVSVITQP